MNTEYIKDRLLLIGQDIFQIQPLDPESGEFKDLVETFSAFLAAEVAGSLGETQQNELDAKILEKIDRLNKDEIDNYLVKFEREVKNG